MDKCKNCGHDVIVYRHPLGYRPLVFHIENGEPHRTCVYPIKEDESGRTPCRCSNPQIHGEDKSAVDIYTHGNIKGNTLIGVGKKVTIIAKLNSKVNMDLITLDSDNK